MRRSPHLWLWVLTLIGIAAPAPALTVRKFTLNDLVRFSTLSGVFTVTRQSYGPSWVAYEIVPQDVWIGTASESFELVLDRFELAMPNLIVGERYVLFLRPGNQFERIIGFRWGALRNDSGDRLTEIEGGPVLITDVRFRSHEVENPVMANGDQAALLDLSTLRARVIAIKGPRK
jgi:hypothetical protein